MLHNFSSAFQVSSCQAEWIWLIANLKSQMSWKSWLLQVQNIRFEKQNCIWLYTITAAAVFALQLSAVLDTQQNGWNTAGSLSDHLASKTVCNDLIFFLQHYGAFLQVPGVFSIFRPRACTYTFFFRDKGEDRAAPSESPWTLQLQLSRGGFSKPPDTATILQRAVAEQCTNCRLCVWPWHRIHCQPACPSASYRLPSLIQIFLMLARKPNMMKCLPSRGFPCPILKANNLH